jgi:hypothetical protein
MVKIAASAPTGGPALSARAIWIAAGVVAPTVRIPAGTPPVVV